MSEVQETQPSQVDTGRYSIGQKILAVGHVLKSKTGTYPAAGFLPGRDELVSIRMFVLTCRNHQKSECAYGSPSLNDGYQFIDEKTGVVYNNQFPESSNQQLSDTNDWTFSVSSKEDMELVEGGMVFLRDVTYIADQVMVAQEYARKFASVNTEANKPLEAADHLENAQLLQNYLETLRLQVRQYGFELSFKPLVWKNKDGSEEQDPEILKAELNPL